MSAKPFHVEVAPHDPREEKLPAWARELIYKLRQGGESNIAYLITYSEENERLRALVDGKYTGEEDGSDTFLVDADMAKRLPLGRTAEIEFGQDRFWTVRLGMDVAKGGTGRQVLVIETTEPLIVIPDDSDRVMIARKTPKEGM